MRDILRINIYTEKMTPEARDSTCSKNLEQKADTLLLGIRSDEGL